MLTTSQAERLQEQLLDLDILDRYELTDSATQIKLRLEFCSEYLDVRDVEKMAFSGNVGIDKTCGGCSDGARYIDPIGRQWRDFLDNRLSSYEAEIRRNFNEV
jgi:hypothetical protein